MRINSTTLRRQVAGIHNTNTKNHNDKITHIIITIIIIITTNIIIVITIITIMIIIAITNTTTGRAACDPANSDWHAAAAIWPIVPSGAVTPRDSLRMVRVLAVDKSLHRWLL